MCFHSWFMLGSIYSSQFKTQSDFYNHLWSVAKECNFSNSDEVVKFLFLTHNNNTHVRKDLLKEMKEDTSLATMLNIVQISEGTIHSEELSKQYLDMIKVSNKQIDSVRKPRSKSGSRNKSHSTSHGGACGHCGSKHPPRKCKAFGKKCHGCGKLNHFITMCRSRNRSQSQSKGNTDNLHATNKTHGSKQNQNQSQNRSHHEFYEVKQSGQFRVWLWTRFNHYCVQYAVQEQECDVWWNIFSTFTTTCSYRLACFRWFKWKDISFQSRH